MILFIKKKGAKPLSIPRRLLLGLPCPLEPAWGRQPDGSCHAPSKMFEPPDWLVTPVEYLLHSRRILPDVELCQPKKEYSFPFPD